VNDNIIDLNFCTQNVRSLNIASKNIITEQKIHAVTKNGCDIVFLSDLRLNSLKQIVACKEISQKFYFRGYKFIHNSPVSSRGVGILVKRTVLEKVSIVNTVRDTDGNYILIDIEYKNNRYTLGSVYGANTNEGISMYDALERDLVNLKNEKIILGGDWNATYDRSDVNVNIDILNMVNIPSLRRSNRIHAICNNLSLIDPYRMLYPDTRDYTFTPMGENQINRSRLDFFLISNVLSEFVINVVIPHSLSSLAFDHKPVSLLFRKTPNNFNHFVKDNYILQEEFGAGVHIAVIECYIIHSIITDQFTIEMKNDILLLIGSLTLNLTEIQDLKLREAREGPSALLTLQIEGKRGEIRENLDALPTMEFLDTLSLEPTPDIFLETLILCVKNNALQEQRRCINVNNVKKSELILKVKTLKKLSLQDRDNNAIILAEAALTRHVEKELKIELENFKKFENLNAEKITPHFMSMVKSSSKNDCPSLICNENNVPFENSQALSAHVETYFSQIYKKEENLEYQRTQDSISNFLGEDILEKEEIRNAKLSENEKLELDSPLTVEELTESINKSNLKSAPGSNGISNKFIKKYWEFFKYPLLKYANFAFTTGRLTDSFRTADIKLIPKKGGDLRKIKNWRPISLLNCFYKCISRVFAARLKKYMNKLTPCAQKGYANGRYCQEVLIGVVDTIETCRSRNIKGALLSLDIQKAFDSLSHSYLKNIFQFFNFGPNITRWLTVLSMNRAARIVINSDISTNIFELERGNAQGDTISPFLFNLGYQILLFKLEYDQHVSGLIENVELGPDFPPLPPHVSRSPPKVYAMADDATVITKMEWGSLARIREILTDFHIISGLACNVEKTTLMQLGSADPVPDNIKDLGFDVQNEIKLLGLKIKSSCSNYTVSKTELEDKVQSQIRFWQRFDLSLSGRISVSKTFMYSQLNYLGCFLPIDHIRLTNIENKIEEYVKGPLNIAKERMTLRREEGGLGLFSLSRFLGSQACTWAKRAQSLDDNWKIRLYRNSLGGVLNLRGNDFNEAEEPILHFIAKNMETFHSNLTSTKKNYEEAYFIDNNYFSYGGENRQLFDKNFFGEAFYNSNRYKLGNLKFSHFLNANRAVKGWAEFIESSGILVPEEKYDIMRRCCSDLLEGGGGPFPPSDTVDLITFCNRFKKGSKPFRRIITGNLRDEIPRNINTFAENSQTIIGLEMGRKINGLWGFTYFSSAMRTFLFKMHNNILGLNNRVAHFIRDHSPICTFCRLLMRGDAPNEDTLHLFYDCPSVETVRDQFFVWAYREDVRYVISRKDLFLVQVIGNTDTVNSNTIIRTIIAKLFLKYIWDSRCRYSLPTLEEAKENIISEIMAIKNASTAIDQTKKPIWSHSWTM